MDIPLRILGGDTSAANSYFEPSALVRHGCGMLLQAGIPCSCRMCAASSEAFCKQSFLLASGVRSEATE